MRSPWFVDQRLEIVQLGAEQIIDAVAA